MDAECRAVLVGVGIDGVAVSVGVGECAAVRAHPASVPHRRGVERSVGEAGHPVGYPGCDDGAGAGAGRAGAPWACAVLACGAAGGDLWAGAGRGYSGAAGVHQRSGGAGGSAQCGGVELCSVQRRAHCWAQHGGLADRPVRCGGGVLPERGFLRGGADRPAGDAHPGAARSCRPARPAPGRARRAQLRGEYAVGRLHPRAARGREPAGLELQCGGAPDRARRTERGGAGLRLSDVGAGRGGRRRGGRPGADAARSPAPRLSGRIRRHPLRGGRDARSRRALRAGDGGARRARGAADLLHDERQHLAPAHDAPGAPWPGDGPLRDGLRRGDAVRLAARGHARGAPGRARRVRDRRERGRDRGGRARLLMRRRDAMAPPPQSSP